MKKPTNAASLFYHGQVVLLAGLALTVSLFQPISIRAQTSPAALPNLQLSTAGLVDAVAVQPDGKIIIGGFFTSVNGFVRNNIARLNVDGSVDVSWDGNVIGVQVFSIAIGGTNIYVGGQFTSAGGVTMDNLAKLDMITGQADPNWLPNPRSDGFNNGNGRVLSVVVVGGSVYASGFFVELGGTCTYDNGGAYQFEEICTTNTIGHGSPVKLGGGGTAAIDGNWNAPGTQNRMFSDGTNIFIQQGGTLSKVDPVAGSGVPGWGYPSFSGFIGGIDTMAFDGTNLYAGGDFTGVNDLGRNYVAKLSAVSGSVNPAWNANIGVTVNGNVFGLAVIGTNIFIASDSTNVGGLNRNTLAKVSTATGAVDPNWSVNPNRLGGVYSLCSLPSGGLLAGGNFQNFDGQRALGAAKLDTTSGALDTFFPAQVQQPGIVTAIAQQPDGKIVLGGDFYLAGGLERPNLARINTDGTLDLYWSPKADGIVRAIAVNGTNVFVGGDFTGMNGLPYNRLAKLNTGTPDAVDTNWNPNADTTVNCLVSTNNDVFVGGHFLNVGGLSRNNLAKLSVSGTGAADALWNPQPNGTFVQGAALGGTNVFVAGNFSSIGGGSHNCLAKLSTLGAGAADSVFNGGVNRLLEAVTVNSSNVYVAGQFFGPGSYHVAKFDALTGVQDSSWNPGISDPAGRFVAFALGLNATNLYIGGNFQYVGGLTRAGVVKVDALNTGAVDPAWEHDLYQTPLPGTANAQAILVNSSGIYVGGTFQSVGGTPQGGFGLLTSTHAPVLIQDTATNFFIFTNLLDSTVPYFRITSISGGALYKSDGLTPVNVGDFISLADGAAGLVFTNGGTVTVVSAFNNTAPGAGAAATMLTMTSNPAPVFMFSATAYSVHEGDGSVTVTVHKYGSGAASVGYFTSDITAVGGVLYQSSSGIFNFNSVQKVQNLIIQIASLLGTQPPDQTFAVNLTNASPGTSIAAPASVVVHVLGNSAANASSFTTTVMSAAPPVSTGVLSVSLQPPNIGAQWRLIGELNWHNSGDSDLGLTTGNYSLEFRQLNGYLQPESVTVPISAGMTNPFTFYYTLITNLATGNLTVTLVPDAVASNLDPNQRGQWRPQGGATNWLNSGDQVTNLNVGGYTVEFKPVAGYVTPSAQIVTVGGNATYGASVTYFVGSAPSAMTPFVVPFGIATTNAPYLYNGQFQTSVGFGSGFVVQQRVVLTAAHVLFDDYQLAYVATARWFFQRYLNQLEPPALIPRGWYIFDGYATQRGIDNSPDISTPASQDLDAAAVFFLSDAGRGGYGGYLASDAANNEFLLNGNNKFLVGYPVNGVTPTDAGKLFATTPADLNFTHLYTSVFATTDIQSYPGNSGGPLYVQSDVNLFLPAAIYLGGSGETLVHAIDTQVVDLITRGVASGNGGGNSTGTGVDALTPGITAPPFGAGLITVNLLPASNPNLGWRITGYTTTNFITTATATLSLIGGQSYPVEFKPVIGYLSPTNRTVQVAIGGQVTVMGNYTGVRPVLKFNSLTNLTFTGATGATYRVDFATNLLGKWTPLVTQALSSGSVTISNLGPPTNRSRFYRTVLLP